MFYVGQGDRHLSFPGHLPYTTVSSISSPFGEHPPQLSHDDNTTAPNEGVVGDGSPDLRCMHERRANDTTYGKSTWSFDWFSELGWSTRVPIASKHGFDPFFGPVRTAVFFVGIE